MGGLVARNSGASADLSIARSYYSGSQTYINQAPVRGCIVSSTGGTQLFTDVHYDSTTCSSLAVNQGAAAGITGDSLAGFQSGSSFTNWLGSVWVFTSGFLPKLIWE
jgi:hypothetical protein